MNGHESKYFNTALCMDEALIELLEEKDLEYITVKELCAKAGVNRSTFYLHYETMDDLVNEALELVNERFLAQFEKARRGFAEAMRLQQRESLVFVTQDYLMPYLRFIRENKSFYRATLRNPKRTRAYSRYSTLKTDVIMPILEQFGVPREYWQYYIAYYTEGITAIIKVWLDENCKASIESIATVIQECALPIRGPEQTPLEYWPRK